MDFISQSRIPGMIVGSTVPAVIASIFVLARFYSRVIIMKNWGHDDSWILFSWVYYIVGFCLYFG
jgi:hypothetical protein